MRKICFVLSLVLFLCQSIASVQKNSETADSRRLVLGAMKEELLRSKKEMKLESYESPYFIGYRWVKTTRDQINYINGALAFQSLGMLEAHAKVDLRVGDYQFDNTATLPRRLGEFEPFDHLDRYSPVEISNKSIQVTFWRLTDDAYRRALESYYHKKGKIIFEKKKQKIASFSREKPNVYMSDALASGFEIQDISQRMRATARFLAENSTISRSEINLHVTHTDRIIVNTEGTEIIDSDLLFQLHIDIQAMCEDGMVVDLGKSFNGRKKEDFPSELELEASAKDLIAKIGKLRKAPVIDPYVGPAILMPQAAGVLFHEAIGHRLEGHRQENDEEGRTFNNHLGKQIMPEFLHLSDNPTQSTYNETPLIGHYKYDDEGVVAQNTDLVTGGILRAFLMSRKPATHVAKSNGHGRAASWHSPVGRMAITTLRSDRHVPMAKLKQLLIEQIKSQKKPYGLIFNEMYGGYTSTRSYDFQAFKTVPYMVYRLYPDGREELVRGVDLVGTPLTVINKVIMASDEVAVFNGYCGAESGTLPVTNISPAVLTTEIELQRSEREREKAPLLPKP